MELTVIAKEAKCWATQTTYLWTTLGAHTGLRLFLQIIFS